MATDLLGRIIERSECLIVKIAAGSVGDILLRSLG